jgi:hypothetical protein
MTQQKNVRSALAMATCSLLGATAHAAGDGNWQVDTALLYYAEQDRVSAAEPVVSATRDLGNEETLNVKLVLDSLTGPSANGAQVEAYAQSFTSPSGNPATNYTVPAGQVPLDEQFKDTRGAVSVNWTAPLENPLWKRSLGANLSSEYDFFSVGLTGVLARDFNNRNTTVTGGLNVEMDTIKPVGGTPIPFAPMSPVAAAKSGNATENRTVTDVLMGVTQVINRRTLMQFNYNFSTASGYLTDPYKIISTGGGTAASFVHENRPDSRTKHALFWQTKYALARGDVIDASYRFMTDDWGVVSNTLDLRYRVMLPANWYVEPHLRWYDQGEADFYTERLAVAPVAGDTSQQFSADYRLGALTDTTLGARVGKRLGETGDAWFSLESMTQSGETEQADLSAMMVSFGYSFTW